MSYDFISGHLKKMGYLSTKKTNACGAGTCIEEKYGLSIVFAYEDSDIFHAAKLLNHGESCLCFVTEEPIGRGLKIYVLNQNSPLESENFNIFEGCFAQVEDCRKIKDTEEKSSYLIRGGLMSHQAMLSGTTELNEGSGNFSNLTRSAHGIARANRNNMIEKLTYSPAAGRTEIRSDPAP